MGQHPAAHTLTPGWPKTHRCFQLWATASNQIVAHMPFALIVRFRLRQLQGLLSDRLFAGGSVLAESCALADALDGMAIEIARREVHARVKARRICAQSLINQ